MKIFVLTGAVFLMCSCNNKHEQQHATNIALVEKYIAAVEAGDYTTIESMLADDYKGHGPSIDDTINKQDGLNSWKYNLENLYESVKYDHTRYIAQTLTNGEYPGEWVSNWAVVIIKYKDGRGPVKLLANSLYKIENGKIARSFTFYNEHDVLEQLGMN